MEVQYGYGSVCIGRHRYRRAGHHYIGDMGNETAPRRQHGSRPHRPAAVVYRVLRRGMRQKCLL